VGQETTTPPEIIAQTGWTQIMFAASCGSLLGLAGVLHFHEHLEDRLWFWGSAVISLLTYPLYWYEALRLTWRRSPMARRAWWNCLIPPLRFAMKDGATGTSLWLPKMGWQPVDAALERRLDASLQMPMLAVSLLVLPLIGVEFLLPALANKHPWAQAWSSWPPLRQATALATAVVWAAFTFEFILRCSVARKKLAYVKQHWLDLLIILLPIIAFLRAAQLGRLLRLQQLTKTTQVYRLRGVAMKTYRALLLVKALERLWHGPPERHLAKLKDQLADKEHELDLLRARIADLEMVVQTALPAGASQSPTTSLETAVVDSR
jgi:hypothetical protein